MVANLKLTTINGEKEALLTVPRIKKSGVSVDSTLKKKIFRFCYLWAATESTEPHRMFFIYPL
jgi:hypothetical protein